MTCQTIWFALIGTTQSHPSDSLKNLKSEITMLRSPRAASVDIDALMVRPIVTKAFHTIDHKYSY